MSELKQPSRIALLPGTLVNQIAAGEVIERPASVVKELIENCIDAGARRIEIDIEAGGTRSIIIHDNGSGIHPEDMQLAILRHTTSKLRTQADLEAINSLGFRGEALSSIASVSDFSISSRIATEEYGRRLQFDPLTGETRLGPAAHPVGTTVEVNNLFQAVPARRKFLRSEKTEFLYILEMVKRLVMSRFDIDIVLRHNSKPVLNCPAVESDYRMRIRAVMGSSFYNNACQIDAQIEDQHLWGWLGDDREARSQSDRQYLYLNRRTIRDKQLNHAIRLAIDEIIPVSRYPSYILYLQLDPSRVDFNVHPTKQEVRFRQPRNVHDFVHAAVRDAMKHMGLELPGVNKLSREQTTRGIRPPVDNILKLYETAAAYSVAGSNQPLQGRETDMLGLPVAVLDDRYVVALYQGDLRIIDFKNVKRHYLHNRLKLDLAGAGIRLRPLLVPVMVKVNEADLAVLGPHFPLLARLGLDIDQSGPDSLVIRSFPAVLPDIDLQLLLAGIIDSIKSPKSGPDNLPEGILELLADHGSVHVSKVYTLKDIEQEFRLFLTAQLPVRDKDCPGLWRTLSITDLQALVHGQASK